MRLHKNYSVCSKVCAAEPLFYQNQFGDFCLLSYPNQVMPKEEIFEEVNFWELFKYKLKSLFSKEEKKK